MTLQSVLVISLSIVSTLAAGLAAERTNTGLPAQRFVLVLAGNLVAVPAIAWLVAGQWAPGAAAVGLLVTAAAPGGSTGPLMALLGRGDPNLAARLFAVLTSFGFVTTVGVSALFFPGEQVVRAAVPVVAGAALLPLLAGVAIRSRLPAIASQALPWAKHVSFVLLVVTIVFLVTQHIERAQPRDAAVAMVIVLASLAIGRIGRTRVEKISIAQVSATRNMTLALLVLGALGSDSRAIIACLGYGLVMFIFTAIVAIAGRPDSKESVAAGKGTA